MMMDPRKLMQLAPDVLRGLADMLSSMPMPKPGPGGGDKTPPDLGEWNKDFDYGNVDYGFSTEYKPPPAEWDSYLPRYRELDMLKPVEIKKKKKFIIDREVGDKPVHCDAEEYSDIVDCSPIDLIMDSHDQRIGRKAFDVPFFQTEDKREGPKGVPYTLFMVDVSGSMSGIRSMHACAAAQAAAELVFEKSGIFVWLPYGSKDTGKRSAIEFTDIESLRKHLREEPFNEGTTRIGDCVRDIAGTIRFGTPYKHNDGEYVPSSPLKKRESKLFVLHDGEDDMQPVTVGIPVYAISLANDHEGLKQLAAANGGKYHLVEKQ